MKIGPLEYVVIGVPEQQLTPNLCAALNAIQETGQICVVDLIFVTKADDGAVAMQEVNELSAGERAAYGGRASDLKGLLTAQDVK